MIDTVTTERSQGQRKRKLEDTIMTEATDAAEEDNQEYLCLIRAKYKNENISTRVNGAEYEKFQQAYSNIIKAYMDALKKKDRKAKVQQKKPAAAASKLKPSA
ncbi:RNA-binding signal recognition particle subunit srp14 [Umbelopsis nana]